MTIDQIECPECRAHALEVPEPNGDTWCANCGEKLNVGDILGTTEEPIPMHLTDDWGK